MADDEDFPKPHKSDRENGNVDLESFRRQWKVELGLESTSAEEKFANEFESEGEDDDEDGEDEEEDDDDDDDDDDEKVEESSVSIEEEADEAFTRAVHCERTGQFYDAIKFYKKALNLVPDIEQRFNQKQTVLVKDQEARVTMPNPVNNNVPVEENQDGDMKTKFLEEIEQNGWSLFQKIREDGKKHFRDLPQEVITYILRWVVSSDLDARSLDVLASVSKGFYVISRDDRLWQSICERIWGKVKTYRSRTEFSSYREMYLTRARVRFDGCYISKITYVRSGENSFQDQSYRPWHLVEYYRYIVFTPSGQLFFLTTSELPANTIPYLRDPVNQTKFPNLLVGHYTLDEHLIYGQCWNPSKIRLKNNTTGSGNIIYNMVLQVLHLKKRFNSALHWIEYYVNIEQKNSILKNEFDIEQVKYPNFFYSRVKSFTREAREALL